MISLLFAFFIIFIPFVPSSALGQTDSVSTARKAVEEFHSEAAEAVKAVSTDDGLMARPEFTERKDAALKELDAIRWSQEPGARRHRRVMSVFEAYTADVIGGIKEAVLKLPAMDAAKTEGLISKITAIKEKKILAIKESLKTEVYRKGSPKPVPSVDRPPREKDTEGGADIWDR